MELEHAFTIPVDVDAAWDVLLDVPRIAPCLPGATLEEADDEGVYAGRVKVKVGPITVTYRGTARITEADADARRAVVEASGKEARGSGTATATVTSTLAPAGEQTRVTVRTDLTVTGRPAQFGRGVMADVAGKLLDRFAECLSAELTGPPAATPAEEVRPGEPGAAQPAALDAADPGTLPPLEADGARPAPPPPSPPRPAAAPQAPALDLVDLAGGPLARRAGPVLAVLVLGAVLAWLLRGRRS